MNKYPIGYNPNCKTSIHYTDNLLFHLSIDTCAMKNEQIQALEIDKQTSKDAVQELVERV